MDRRKKRLRSRKTEGGKLPLETAIIERYKRRESSVEEALVEMYLAGVSMRRVKDITEVVGRADECQHGEPDGPEGVRADRSLAAPWWARSPTGRAR